jgi:hypothetical protein
LTTRSFFVHPWAFRARFRRTAFGWKGTKLAIKRIHEALAEIRAVARHDPASAAEGAVLFLEKLSPALNQIDSSSGALGNATYSAVQELVPIISSAPADAAVQMKWLDRLFDAIQDDDPPYIEHLGDLWGDLCATPELAAAWADRLVPTQRSVLLERKRGTYAFFSGTTLCYSALFKAGRHDELRAGSTTSLETIARFAEAELLKAGRRAEAFDQYALLANQGNSNLSTFRALAKKYPELAPDKLLGHLIASTPGEPGKWFATAKTLKLYDRATQLAWASPCDPKTLTRAARDHLVKQPAFAMQCALAALHWMSVGHGYELTGFDAHEAHRLAIEATGIAQQSAQAQAAIEQVLTADRPMSAWLRKALGITTSASAPPPC